MKLVTMMAKACNYAQEHINDLDAWPKDIDKRVDYLQCVSYQMACFLAQNTKKGKDGIEWDIVLESLVKHPMKTETQWTEILNGIAKEFGGWNKSNH